MKRTRSWAWAALLLAGCSRPDPGRATTERLGSAGDRDEQAPPPVRRSTICDTLPREPPVFDGLHAVGAVEGRNPAHDGRRLPHRVVEALRVRTGWKVADVGAGLGYFEPRLAEAVGPAGLVVATDVNPVALDALCRLAPALSNVEVRRTPADDPELEAGTYDLVLLSEVDHFLHDRVSYLRMLSRALAPGGSLAVTHARSMREPLLAAAMSAGLHVVREVDDLPDHYLVFLQP